MTSVKEPVRLRRKKLANGSQSLYLDIYFEGVRSYEFLKLYLVPEKTRADKDANKTTMQLAAAVKAQRIVEIQQGKFGMKKVESGKVFFFPYFEAVINLKKEGRRQQGRSALKHLRLYEPREKLTFAQITPEWTQGFVTFLASQALVKPSTQILYVDVLKNVLRHAMKDGIIPEGRKILPTPGKAEAAERTYLTSDELRRLAEAPCPNDALKRAFLFSCLTGLRFSDVSSLTQDNITRTDTGVRLTFRQKKTSRLEYIDINASAARLLGKPSHDGRFFPMTKFNGIANSILKVWCRAAGINKRVTFHASRHTFAVQLLEKGVDIYTVSKLLGHSDLGTTQVYARILDKAKRRAVSALDDLI
jgi:integrase